MLTPALWIAGSALLLGAALFVHTRIRGFLPEDPPGPGRKRHPRPTPMAGAGCAALAATALGVGGMPWAAAGVGIAGGVGLLDDVRKEHGTGIRWTTKAIALGAAAGCCSLALADWIDSDWIGWCAVFAALFVLTNATNFLDNQDGVATALGVAALLLSGGGAPDALAMNLAGIWIAFLPFNWPKARLFLGDGGALALGLCAATIVLRAAARGGEVDIVAAAAPVAVLLFDFAQVVTARLVLGYAPWIADRRHVTHVLLTRGVSRVALAPLLAALAVAIGLIVPAAL